jgi:hypothetical protein
MRRPNVTQIPGLAKWDLVGKCLARGSNLRHPAWEARCIASANAESKQQALIEHTLEHNFSGQRYYPVES